MGGCDVKLVLPADMGRGARNITPDPDRLASNADSMLSSLTTSPGIASAAPGGLSNAPAVLSPVLLLLTATLYFYTMTSQVPVAASPEGWLTLQLCNVELASQHL